MAVTVRFADGKQQNFPIATDAFIHGDKMVVTQDQRELASFDSEQVVLATLRGNGGATVQTVPGRAKSVSPMKPTLDVR